LALLAGWLTLGGIPRRYISNIFPDRRLQKKEKKKKGRSFFYYLEAPGVTEDFKASAEVFPVLAQCRLVAGQQQSLLVYLNLVHLGPCLFPRLLVLLRPFDLAPRIGELSKKCG